jgi:CBS domain-containing protein
MTVSLPRSEPTRGSALAYASFRVLTTSPGDSVADVLSRLRTSDRLETSADIAVVEEGRLVGLIAIEDLLAAEDGAVASSIMDPRPAFGRTRPQPGEGGGHRGDQRREQPGGRRRDRVVHGADPPSSDARRPTRRASRGPGPVERVQRTSRRNTWAEPTASPPATRWSSSSISPSIPKAASTPPTWATISPTVYDE